MKPRLLLLVLLAVLLPAVGARAADLQQVVRTLESPFRAGAPQQAAIRDFQADFAQESTIASLDRSQKGAGTVAMRFVRSDPAKPALVQFNWDYREPNRQVIVSDGKTMWVYVPENQQVVVSDLAAAQQGGNNNPLTFLSGLGDLGRDFNIAFATPDQDTDGNWVLELTPRHPSPLIVRLLIAVDGKAVATFVRGGTTGDILPLRASTVFDPAGNRTHIAFSHVRLNQGLGDKDFQFTPPAGVEVLHADGQKMGF